MTYTPVSRQSSFNPSPFKPAGIASYKSVENDYDAFEESTPLPQKERAKRRNFSELNPKEQEKSVKAESIREAKKMVETKKTGINFSIQSINGISKYRTFRANKRGNRRGCRIGRRSRR